MKRAWSVLFFLSCMSVHATIVRLDALPEMSENADIIAHVVVGHKVAKKDPDGRIVELSTVEVLDGIKGAKTGDLLTIYQVGGILGQSRFAFGEEMVLFGMKHHDMVVSYGVGLGKFRVLREGNKTAVVEDLHNLIGADGFLKARHYPSLARFMGAIEESLQAPWQVVPVGPKRRQNDAQSRRVL